MNCLSPVSEGALDEAHWPQHYPACGGQRQSPINLQRTKVRYNPALEGLKLTGYETQKGKFPMVNNGHTGKGKGWRGAPIHGQPLAACRGRQVTRVPARSGLHRDTEHGLRTGGLEHEGRTGGLTGPETWWLFQRGQHPSFHSAPCWSLPAMLSSYSSSPNPRSR